MSQSNQTTFDESALSDFLKSGWIIGCDAERFLIGWGDWEETDSPKIGEGFSSLFAPDFYVTSSRPWIVTSHWDVVRRSRLDTLFSSITALEVNRELDSITPTESQLYQWVEPDLGAFSNAFKAIQEGFSTRGLRKAVPVVFASRLGVPSRDDRLSILRKLLGAPPELIPYGLWREHLGGSYGIMGATPETLFKISDQFVETVALAGTRRKTAAPAEDAVKLLEDPKERHEHQIVIDDICEVLSPFGRVVVGETRVVELPTLLHLLTPIRVETSGSLDFVGLTKALHPTPALGLSPRALGFREMKYWDQPEIRDRFGAPFGVSATTLNGERMNRCLVAIRNLQWSNGKSQIGSGCGIVPASVETREWSELQLKRDSVKRLLDL